MRSPDSTLLSSHVIALLVLIGIVVIAGLAEVAYEVVTGLIQPPVFFLGVAQLIDTFGLVLLILIGLQLMATMHMYLSDHTIHVEMVLLVALTAVTRKVVILDTVKTEPLLVLGLGLLFLALSGGYFLIRKK